MTVTDACLCKAISTIASIKGINMAPQHLLLDILALSKVPAFAGDDKFNSVIYTISQGLIQLFQDPTIGDSLKNNFSGFKSLHKNPNPPPIRHMMIYASFLPNDFYARIKESKKV